MAHNIFDPQMFSMLFELSGTSGSPYSSAPYQPGLFSNGDEHNYKPVQSAVVQVADDCNWFEGIQTQHETPFDERYQYLPTPPDSDRYKSTESPALSPPARRRFAKAGRTRPPPQKLAVTISTSPPKAANGLRFTNAHDAKSVALKQAKVTIPSDDWQQVKANPEYWVKRIMSAFEQEYLQDPPRCAKDGQPIDKHEWLRYQNDHIEKINAHMESDDSITEIGCWLLYQAIVDAHEFGFRNYKPESCHNICSVHMEEAIQTVTDFAIVRWDVIRCERMHDLGTSCRAVVARKVANFVTNYTKKKRDLRNRERFGAEYSPVLGAEPKSTGGAGAGAKRKRGRESVEVEAREGATNAKKRMKAQSRPKAQNSAVDEEHDQDSDAHLENE